MFQKQVVQSPLRHSSFPPQSCETATADANITLDTGPVPHTVRAASPNHITLPDFDNGPFVEPPSPMGSDPKRNSSVLC